jgi:hypothetical protein
MAIVETTDWEALRMIRMGGHKPGLPVIVTTKPGLPRRLQGVGCLTILHRAGEVMPIKLLDGLDVIFFFDRCKLALHVKHLAQAKGVRFASAKTWCTCANLLSILPLSCDSHAAAVNWAETGNAA